MQVPTKTPYLLWFFVFLLEKLVLDPGGFRENASTRRIECLRQLQPFQFGAGKVAHRSYSPPLFTFIQTVSDDR